MSFFQTVFHRWSFWCTRLVLGVMLAQFISPGWSQNLSLSARLMKREGIDLHQWSTVTAYLEKQKIDPEQLKELSISDCNLTILPQEIFTLPNLERLDLTNNRLRDVSALRDLENLKKLYLPSTKLSTLPDWIKRYQENTSFGIALMGNPLLAHTCDPGAIGWKDIEQWVRLDLLPVMKVSPEQNPLNFPDVLPPQIQVHCQHPSLDARGEKAEDPQKSVAALVSHTDSQTDAEDETETPLTLADLPLEVLETVFSFLDAHNAGHLAQTSRPLRNAALFAGGGFLPGTRLGPDPWTLSPHYIFQGEDCLTSLSLLNVHGVRYRETEQTFRLDLLPQDPFVAEDGKTYGAIALELFRVDASASSSPSSEALSSPLLTSPTLYVELKDKVWTEKIRKNVRSYLWRETQKAINKAPFLLRNLWQACQSSQKGLSASAFH